MNLFNFYLFLNSKFHYFECIVVLNQEEEEDLCWRTFLLLFGLEFILSFFVNGLAMIIICQFMKI